MKAASFNNIRELVKTGYFYINERGNLELNSGVTGEIIDCHTHMGWSYYLSKPIDLLKKSKTKYFFPEDCRFSLNTYSAYNFDKENSRKCKIETVRGIVSSKGYSSTHTAPNLLEEMKRMKINKAILLAIDIPRSTRHSKQILSVADLYDSFIPFVSLHPLALNKKGKLEGYLNRGARGLKLHPIMQATKPTNKKYYKIYQLAQENHLPVFFHTGHSPLSGRFSKRFVKKEDFAKVIKDFPKVNFILGHSGIADYEYMAGLGKNYENVWLDLNSQPPKAIKKIISIMGDERVVFGSDWPYYPIALSLVKVLIATEGKEKIRENILSKNIRRLLKNT